MERERIEYHKKIREHLSSSYLLSDEKIEAVMPQFLNTIKKLMSELDDLAAMNKPEALSRTGHAMKGALLNLGLQDLAQKAFFIEKHKQISEPDLSYIQLVKELKQEIKKII